MEAIIHLSPEADRQNKHQKNQPTIAQGIEAHEQPSSPSTFLTLTANCLTPTPVHSLPHAATPALVPHSHRTHATPLWIRLRGQHPHRRGARQRWRRPGRLRAVRAAGAPTLLYPPSRRRIPPPVRDGFEQRAKQEQRRRWPVDEGGSELGRRQRHATVKVRRRRRREGQNRHPLLLPCRLRVFRHLSAPHARGRILSPSHRQCGPTSQHGSCGNGHHGCCLFKMV